MQQKILYLFTRTPLHVGAGSSVGAIDQPIQRERHTGFPIIPGSSLKGVLRDRCRELNDAGLENMIFGDQDKAGSVSISEARLIAFPVRSAKGAFAFATSNLALNRFRRDGRKLTMAIPEDPSEMTCLAGEQVVLDNQNVVLEEYRFKLEKAFPQDLESALLGLVNEDVWKIGKGRFALLSNGDFAHFVVNACEVNQHVKIKPETGTAQAGALFNEECIPSECLLYAVVTIGAREKGEWSKFESDIMKQPLLQVGGNSTTGLGFCSISFSEV